MGNQLYSVERMVDGITSYRERVDSFIRSESTSTLGESPPPSFASRVDRAIRSNSATSEEDLGASPLRTFPQLFTHQEATHNFSLDNRIGIVHRGNSHTVQDGLLLAESSTLHSDIDSPVLTSERVSTAEETFVSDDNSRAAETASDVVVAKEAVGNLGRMVRQLSLDQFENGGRRMIPINNDLSYPTKKFSRQKSPQGLRKKIISTLLRPRSWNIKKPLWHRRGAAAATSIAIRHQRNAASATWRSRKSL
ncbi:hypothetical protein Fmac_014584 [Flemingia macrophylla]|uniref:Uncharacterized protein n=1 Tax=Flemingia macrophylla TaxID=520843 RepID=A0ABD1MC50_9FABA